RRSGFYVTLDARSTRGAVSAVAARVVDARAPADRLTSALADRLAARLGLACGLLCEPDALFTDDSLRSYTVGAGTVLAFVASGPRSVTARLFRLTRARAAGGVLLTLGLIICLLTQWRQASGALERLTPIAVALACLALVPLNLLSSFSPIFDPAVYF